MKQGRYVCYVIVAFRDLANALKTYPGSRTVPVIRYTDMRARMQNETLANAPIYVAISPAFYPCLLSTGAKRMAVENEVC